MQGSHGLLSTQRTVSDTIQLVDMVDKSFGSAGQEHWREREISPPKRTTKRHALDIGPE
jgi:hypothetical protein